ncbi:Glu-tRNA(Gln) amidotransferase subunit GatE [Candidatus Micrarchaeota archaeon]|nr:Glu-tRNA(Gln) amidotransferase subunit GatE [Candidatus Micrarchaeota archaeon]
MKVGIEIHQRLDTHKLFCNCPSRLVEKEPDLLITRQLHPVFSELGEIDEASRAEYEKRKVFEYQVFHESNCLVEIDEEPPHTMNEDALKIVLGVAKQLHAKPVDEVHIMRKVVIDGSNTSGFQRTSVVALNGHLKSSKGTVRIPTIALEEESAGIVASESRRVTYRLDRLGIPLIEIATDPDIKDGEHLREVAEKLGMILRATGRVARGLGTIRQDVNISTAGGARVEIKGAQELKMLPLYVENEEQRQVELVKILLELRKRKALPVELNPVDVTSVFSKTDARLIRKGVDSGMVAMAQKLAGHKGLLGRQIQKGRRYGTELSDYAKLAGVKGIIHGDEDLSKYKISEAEEKGLGKKLDLGGDDVFVMVVAPAEQATKALEHAVRRASMDFVPEETRKARPDGTSSFMRPLPGRARLYPETDVPPIPVDRDLLASVESYESPEEKRKRLSKMLNPEMAERMMRSRNIHLFEKLVEKGADPMLAATTLEDTVVSLRREGIKFKDLEGALLELFREYNKGKFVKAAIPEILRAVAKGASVDSVLRVYRLQKVSGRDLGKLVEEEGYDMKKVMQKHRLQVDPAEVAEIIKKKPKKRHSEYR